MPSQLVWLSQGDGKSGERQEKRRERGGRVREAERERGGGEGEREGRERGRERGGEREGGEIERGEGERDRERELGVPDPDQCREGERAGHTRPRSMQRGRESWAHQTQINAERERELGTPDPDQCREEERAGWAKNLTQNDEPQRYSWDC